MLKLKLKEILQVFEKISSHWIINLRKLILYNFKIKKEIKNKFD